MTLASPERSQPPGKTLPSLKILYDAAQRGGRQKVLALKKLAPADFDLSFTALPNRRRAALGFGRAPVDLVLVLAAHAVGAVRRELLRLGWSSRLIVYWGAGPAREIELFNSIAAGVDAWVFGDRDSCEILGHPPNSLVMPGGVDIEIAGELPEAAGRRSQARRSGKRSATEARTDARLFEFLRAIAEQPAERHDHRPDLSEEVTVFVSTVGAPTFDTCVARLRRQDCSFRLRIIDRVAPMNAAFQRMLEECRTPYYVQVDEDMLLHPHAIRTLYEAIAGADAKVAMVVADLYDVHLERCILGVKIFRHNIVRRFPFKTIDAFETDQLKRLRAAGYRNLRISSGCPPIAHRPLGLHGTRWTLQSIYERYTTLEHRRRVYPAEMDWFDTYPAVFLRRYLDDPSTENFFALQGIIAGALAAHRGEASAKDYRAYPSLAGFRPLLRFLEETGSVPQPPRHRRRRAAAPRGEKTGAKLRKRAGRVGRSAAERRRGEGKDPISG